MVIFRIYILYRLLVKDKSEGAQCILLLQTFREFLSLYPIVSLLIGINIVAFILTTAPIFPESTDL